NISIVDEYGSYWSDSELLRRRNVCRISGTLPKPEPEFNDRKGERRLMPLSKEGVSPRRIRKTQSNRGPGANSSVLSPHCGPNTCGRYVQSCRSRVALCPQTTSAMGHPLPSLSAPASVFRQHSPES